MTSELTSGRQEAHGSMGSAAATPDIINWPIQKRKMWHGKGHLPPWSEVRQVAGHAIDDALRTHSIEQLIDIVRTPCREAGLRAARNKHDKNAHLKREYHNMVMDLLAEALLKQEQEQLQNDAAKPTLGGRGAECLKGQQRQCVVEAQIDELTRRIDNLHVDARNPKSIENPCFLGPFRSLCSTHKPQLSTPSAGTSKTPLHNACNATVEEGSKETRKEGPKLPKEPPDVDMEEWVKVANDIESGWVCVKIGRKPT